MIITIISNGYLRCLPIGDIVDLLGAIIISGLHTKKIKHQLIYLIVFHLDRGCTSTHTCIDDDGNESFILTTKLGRIDQLTPFVCSQVLQPTNENRFMAWSTYK